MTIINRRKTILGSLCQKTGFTLIEIIIVIIIIGVLASLALPRLFGKINSSKATEALNIMGYAKRGIDRCAFAQGASQGDTGPDFNGCHSWQAIGLNDPGAVGGANFTYGWTVFNVGTEDIELTATGNDPPTGTITMTYSTNDGVLSKSGTNDFSDI